MITKAGFAIGIWLLRRLRPKVRDKSASAFAPALSDPHRMPQHNVQRHMLDDREGSARGRCTYSGLGAGLSSIDHIILTRLGWPGSGQGDTSYWPTRPFLLAAAFVPDPQEAPANASGVGIAVLPRPMTTIRL